MNRGDFPNDLRIHVGVVVRYDVAHAAHFTKGKLRDGTPGFFCQMGGGFPDDFDRPDDGILFLRVNVELGFRGILDIRGDAACRLQMSRKRPSCSASIDTDGRGEDMLARELIRRLLK